jgi:hypothetical protein
LKKETGESMRKVETHPFEDSSIVPFLSLNQKLKIIPQKADSGKVVFLVEGPNINKALSALYNNEKVGALDFIKAMKAMRSSIFALKN